LSPFKTWVQILIRFCSSCKLKIKFTEEMLHYFGHDRVGHKDEKANQALRNIHKGINDWLADAFNNKYYDPALLQKMAQIAQLTYQITSAQPQNLQRLFTKYKDAIPTEKRGLFRTQSKIPEKLVQNMHLFVQCLQKSNTLRLSSKICHDVS
jgi:hypothetical protein